MAKRGLEKVVKQDITPVVSEVMHKFLGVSIDELNKDISEKLNKSPLADFPIDTAIPFKEAKKRFKQAYLRRLLRVNYGNISEVAKQTGVDRRSIHRIVQEAGIDVAKIRQEMLRPYDVKQKVVSDAIEDVLENYRSVIHPDKLKEVYAHVPELSKDLIGEIPVEAMPLKKAEEEFEKEYLRKALLENKHNLQQTAQKVQLRYETLLRKIKRYDL